MPRKSTRNAAGSGSIRKKTVTRGEREYQFWEARYTDSAGKRHSISGDTQKEVAEKLRAATKAIDEGSYTPPQKLKLADWMDSWLEIYVKNSVKPNTYLAYKNSTKTHIKPILGAIQLQKLNPDDIQQFCNKIKAEGQRIKIKDGIDNKPLKAKTVKNVHGILSKALSVAVRNGYIRTNPAAVTDLPRHEKSKIMPLDENDIKCFLLEIENEPRYKNLFTVALFSGLREAELLGLQWSCVNFMTGTITVDKQLYKVKETGGAYHLAPTKTDNIRIVTVAPTVISALQDEQARQLSNQLKAGGVDGAFRNPDDLVFTDELGKHLVARTVVKHYKNIVTKLGIPERRFHDLRHSYATAALANGDSIKDVQTALGHTEPNITLSLYAHSTAETKKASADRMERFIQTIKEAQQA